MPLGVVKVEDISCSRRSPHNLFPPCSPMFKLTKLTVLLVASLIVAPVLLTAQIVAPPPGFNITSLEFPGAGCPLGSAYYLLSADKSALTVAYSQYWVESGSGIPISVNRKNCQLAFGIAVPSGFTFGISTVDNRSYYFLDSGVTAAQISIYYFPGSFVPATARYNITGPMAEKDYSRRDAFDFGSSVYSFCGVPSTLYVMSDIRVNNTANTEGSGYVGTDPLKIDTFFEQTFNLQWQRC
ncbi:unnamed protein product [Cyclocybe aegerita]|uniref:DUF4360 domain-containing protein n=1 Tax=Cyclocybe aegerita TaxID=1973307 RepID=A0A8S0WY08_CYCAE|nr:unnamed protein product [Cyclocybe aegerita]